MTMYAGPMVSSGDAYPLRQHDRQEKQFIDTTGAFWQNGELEDKAMGVFTSTATIHGGQETTIITSLVALLHLGLVFARHALQAAPADPDHRTYRRLDLRPRYLGRPDTSRQPVEDELTTARNLGHRAAQVAEVLKGVRQER